MSLSAALLNEAFDEEWQRPKAVAGSMVGEQNYRCLKIFEHIICSSKDVHHICPSLNNDISH